MGLMKFQALFFLIIFSFSFRQAYSQSSSGTFADTRDGQTYNWVRIGKQVWMAENLNYYKSSGSWYYNDDSTANYDTYGRLYNWDTASTSCPDNWSLPGVQEWDEFTDTLGGTSVAGGKLKEAGTTNWTSPNTSATNESGFTALPSGYRNTSGGYTELGTGGFFWSATERDTEKAYGRYLTNTSAGIMSNFPYKSTGFSVRCLKNSPPVPYSLSTQPGSGQITIHWSVNEEAYLAYYKIYRNTSNDSLTADSINFVLKPDTSFTNNNLLNNTTYYYWVSAVDSFGNESGLSVGVSGQVIPVCSDHWGDTVVEFDYIENNTLYNLQLSLYNVPCYSYINFGFGNIVLTGGCFTHNFSTTPNTNGTI